MGCGAVPSCEFTESKCLLGLLTTSLIGLSKKQAGNFILIIINRLSAIFVVFRRQLLLCSCNVNIIDLSSKKNYGWIIFALKMKPYEDELALIDRQDPFQSSKKACSSDHLC